MKVEFHPEAELELIEAASYYELQVPGLGEDFEVEVRRATDLLRQHPELGPHLDDELRRFVLIRFPYTLIYSVSSRCCTSWWSPIRTAAPDTGDRE
jgi:plasmid stabilization system protein ParE